MTEAEIVLWEALRAKKLDGLKFRRQHAMGPYIADFYCHAIKIVIEVDGGVHRSTQQQDKDKSRDQMMSSWGVTLIRLNNEIVVNNIEKVLVLLTEKIKELRDHRVTL